MRVMPELSANFNRKWALNGESEVIFTFRSNGLPSEEVGGHRVAILPDEGVEFPSGGFKWVFAADFKMALPE